MRTYCAWLAVMNQAMDADTARKGDASMRLFASIFGGMSALLFEGVVLGVVEQS